MTVGYIAVGRSVTPPAKLDSKLQLSELPDPMGVEEKNKC
jgi:hypothetical protein